MKADKSEINKNLEIVLNDKTSGSSELLIKLNKLVLKTFLNNLSIQFILKNADKRLSHFSIISRYISDLKELQKSGSKIEMERFLTGLENKMNNRYISIYKKMKPVIKNINTVLTISNSNTLFEFFSLWSKENKKLKVIICESRPKLEGRILASSLMKENINVELITDAMAGIYIPKIDAVITGADSILSNKNIVNKTGSKTLAIMCKQFKKPYYVIATKDKIIKKKTHTAKFENPDEIWKHSKKGLVISNIYFEVVENKYITKIYTD